jgi:hypothetical protein
MFRIRNEQFRAIQRQLEDNFVAAMMKQLQSEHAPVVAGIPDPALKSRVARSIAKGREYGFTLPASLFGFLIFSFEVGPEFDRHPAFKSALRNTRHYRDQVARIEAIFHLVTDQQWKEAQDQYSALAWQAPERTQ